MIYEYSRAEARCCTPFNDLDYVMRKLHVFIYLMPAFDRAGCSGLSCELHLLAHYCVSYTNFTQMADYISNWLVNGFWTKVLLKNNYDCIMACVARLNRCDKEKLVP